MTSDLRQGLEVQLNLSGSVRFFWAKAPVIGAPSGEICATILTENYLRSRSFDTTHVALLAR